MIEYYKEKLTLAEEKAGLMERGFISVVREIADALSICPKEDVKAISEQLTLAVQVMEEVDEEVAYYEDKIKAMEKAKNDELLSM
jgi:hypothetical protein